MKDRVSFETNSTSWIAASEKYTEKLAASSANLKRTASCKLSKELMVEKWYKVLVAQVEIKELQQ